MTGWHPTIRIDYDSVFYVHGYLFVTTQQQSPLHLPQSIVNSLQILRSPLRSRRAARVPQRRAKQSHLIRETLWATLHITVSRMEMWRVEMKTTHTWKCHTWDKGRQGPKLKTNKRAINVVVLCRRQQFYHTSYCQRQLPGTWQVFGRDIYCSRMLGLDSHGCKVSLY